MHRSPSFGRRWLRAAIVSLLILLPAFAARAAAKAAPDKNLTTANAFVRALNHKDQKTLAALSAAPFSYITREFQADGSDFKRGELQEKTFSTQAELASFLKSLPDEMHIDGPKGRRATPSKKTPLLGTPAPASWNGLKVFTYLRNLGDVEHTVLIGVNPESGKVAGTYGD